ncbi:acetate kinase [Microbulbifer sp. THAF38]|uniref:acetate kinase n=1 Tax=Microbulbifer sp. THAF38 TaxID=2587856 RepID=UPI001268402C|nr:acetate kinase [Microbulbifer sp. THAF38]QFT54727.1 Acetate kinase [Microbulbifer sp. THAF38]
MSAQNLVLIFNCGSSSLKLSAIDPTSGEEHLNGQADALNTSSAVLKWQYCDKEGKQPLSPGDDYDSVIGALVERFAGPWSELRKQLVAIGHRVVHGGEQFADSALIDNHVLSAIRACCELAPLHNPAALQGIQASLVAFPELPQVAVFDTAFHQSLPDYAYLYALPYRFYRDHHLRRYGMHGSSHRYIGERCAELLNKPTNNINVISAHLGNGASLCAIKEGQSVDTSMGLTPLEGLVMGSRCGDLDPGLLLHLGEALDYSLAELELLLNRNSGLLGISELSNDCRELEEAMAKGHAGASLALKIFCYRLAKYIAAYTVPLKRVDSLVFTGGIGENSAWVRRETTGWLSQFGYQLDEMCNEEICFGAEGRISKDETPDIFVIPTREEWVIARDTIRLASRAT